MSPLLAARRRRLALPYRRAGECGVVVAVVGKRIAMPSTDEPGGERWAPSPGEKQPAEGGREEVEEQLAAQSRDQRAEADDEVESDEVEEQWQD
jgi:hypothetical protein